MTTSLFKRGILVIDAEPHMAGLVATMLYAIGKRDIRETSDARQAMLSCAAAASTPSSSMMR